jgi:hypothetical protein
MTPEPLADPIIVALRLALREIAERRAAAKAALRARQPDSLTEAASAATSVSSPAGPSRTRQSALRKVQTPVKRDPDEIGGPEGTMRP